MTALVFLLWLLTAGQVDVRETPVGWVANWNCDRPPNLLTAYHCEP